MTKKEKEQYRKGKRNSDSESEFSYRSYVSDGGTRHVARRRRREDGTYSDEHSYHSSQDEDGEARRRRRRRDREHGADSAHSYYSVVSEGGTRTVRRRRKREDGTYSDSEAFNSDKAGTDSEGGGKGGDDGDYGLDRDGKNSEGESEDSDVSVYSEVSEGGTRHQMQRKRIRDADGNVVGYGEPEPYKPKKKSSNIGDVGSDRDKNEALGSLNQKRDGELLREVTTDSLKGLREDGEDLIPPNIDWPGREAAGKEQKLLQETEEHIPSDFSDATTEDDIDLSKLTPAQRRQYLAEKERRRKEREKRRREKYGDSYDEIMKKKNAKKHEELSKKLAEKEAEDKARKEAEERQGNGRDRMGSRRWSNASSLRGGGGRPKSMVTYDKAPPRGLSDTGAVDKREIGLAHDEWSRKDKKGRRGSAASDGSDIIPKLHRETTMLKQLPTIPQGRVPDEESSKKKRNFGNWSDDETDNQVEKAKEDEPEPPSKIEKEPSTLFEVGADGKLRLRNNWKKIDLSKITKEELLALGIDPNLSAKEIAKKLKQMFGKDVQIVQDGVLIGTKGIHEYDRNVDDDTLARDPDLDVNTLTGVRRVNVIMTRGGQELQDHMKKVIRLSKLVDQYAKDLDEKADIDFLSHYRLVDPAMIEAYARAFVVEDGDLDAVINTNEARVALDGVPSIQNMTSKQMEYVMRVLKIDEATLITFRMFAVVTALCERVTHMDSLSQRLLEICNLADIERKLELYKAMFYTNTESDRDANYITSESLKIELIAGGLNWKQQQYIMEKMEPNQFGDISFLDYMCYIPLFLSMHDNIVYNPLDMSSQKYQQPPRERPPSVQRDMNPLGCDLTKQSAYWVRKKAIEMMSGTSNNAVQVSRSYMDILKRYKADRYTRLKKVDDHRAKNMSLVREPTASSISEDSGDMIY